jgi:hypothetical protein
MSIAKRFWVWIKRFGSLGSTARSRLQRELTRRLRPSRRRLLRLESLESRRVFATASLSSGMLSIDLNQTDEVAYLYNDGTSLRLASNQLASELSFSTAAVTSIQVTDTTLRTGQSFSFSYGLPLSLSGSLSVSQIETVVFGSELTVSGASGLSVTAGQSIQVRAPLSTAGGPIVFSARDGITITQPVISNGGNQTLDADNDADGVGTLTLDFPVKEFTDPNPNSGNGFGTSVLVLPSGNVAITSPNDDAGGSNAGAVYLFNGMTGSVVSTLRGSTANDQVGSTGLTQLTNGNYVVASSNWDSGSVTNVGAVTWGNGTSGISGAVSASNSLVGSTASDFSGSSVTALTNGNYVVASSAWDSGAISNVGAVTWGNGTSGISGVVSSSNSLVGATLNDNVGNGGVTALSNGNYVVRSTLWNSGTVADVGAVTWGNGTSGISGAVSLSNSLVGATLNDNVGNGGVTALSNGNYFVISSAWDSGATVDVGAVTWGNGTSGISGVVSASNSLVGSGASDNVGGTGVTALTNGNYVVRSSNWNSGATADVGAVTWGNGTSGRTGVVSASNSLVGSTLNDAVGGAGVTALTNGNYVVRSSNWNSGATVDVGAVTWGNGTSGISGAVSASNSLVGSSFADVVGSTGVTALANGNYVVRSASWNSGATTSVGAVTWGNGTSGRTGVVSASNSLVGSTANDQVGSTGVTALANGNYVVRSGNWDSGGIINVGAVTWGNGTSGRTGVVSASNSLVGSTLNDAVGGAFVIALANGNYVVVSAFWDSGTITGVGAVTWGDGISGISGVVSSGNSLVGSRANDSVGSNGVTALTNGNYVVVTQTWDSGTISDVGAVTWGSGVLGVSGAVSASNSLVGSTASDNVGLTGVTALTNGNYVVRSSNWDSGTVSDVGAVTWGNGTSGISGVVSSSNSLVGSKVFDPIGDSVTALTNGNYVVRSTLWDSGTIINAGAVTWGNGASGVSGRVSSSNSIVGQTANIGSSWAITTASNLDAFLASNPSDGSGRVVLGSSARGFSLPSTPAGSLQAANGSVSISVAGTNLQGTISSNANVTIAPSQTARQIDLGSKPSGKLGLSDTELDGIAAATLRIGNSTSGDLTVSSPISRPTSTAMQLTSGGAILFGTGAQSANGAINTAGGTLGLDAGTTIRPGTPGVDANTSALSFAAGDTLQMDITGATVDSQYSQLSVVGPVTLTGVTLSLNVNFPAMIGTETFTIVNATGGVTGQFSGLIQGGAISVGSFAYTANYTANSVELVPVTSGIAPAITQSPSNQAVVTGNTATFTANASGSPTPTVQWQVSTNGGTSWGNILGATNTTYSFTTVSGDNGNQYRAVFTNTAGSATSSAATLTFNSAPSVNQNPSSSTVNSGATASFTAAATGNPTPTVQWQISTNGGTIWSNISNATSTTYSFTAASVDNGNQYRAVFTNTAGSATSSAATLTVNYAPSVTQNPSSSTVNSGATASFTAAATGNPTPTVQWQISTNGGTIWSNISNATSTTYSFTAASVDNGNQYRAVFTNTVGSATSSAATLTVNYAPSVTQNPSSSTVSSGSTASFTAAATGNPTPTVQWQVSTNGGANWSNILGATNTTYSFTAVSGDNGNQYRAVFTNTAGSATSSAATLTVSGDLSVTQNPSSSTVNSGATASFTAAATGNPTPTVQWQVSTNGGSNWSNISNATNTTYSFTTGSGDNGNQYRAVFTNTVGSATSSAATLTVNYAPSVTQNPSSSTVNSGATASFTAAATGNPTPTVQWQISTNGGSNWSNISNATNTTYSFTTGSGDNGNQYRAVFTNTVGSATSSAATLTVSGDLSVTQNPSSSTVNSGSTASFTAAATGNPTPTVQWQISTNGGTIWSNISNATSTTYSFTTASGDNGNQYRAVFTNTVGSATSSAATLTVNYAPSVTQNPSSSTVNSGSTANFTAAATGNPTPTVQWQVSTNDGSLWSDISGATSTTYSFTAASGDNGNQYRAVFTNIVGSATSSAATLTVNYAPSVTQNPSSSTVNSGSTASFTAAAIGNPTPTVQWQVSTNGGSSWSNISNATSTTYSFTTGSGDNGKQYRAVFTNTAGSATSSAAVLSVVTLDVSRGQVQRSYVRYLDITTGQGSDASQIVSSSRIRLRKADLDGNGSQNVPLTGFLSANGANISIDFGAAGIQNSRNTNRADGYYTLELDLDNDNVFETSLTFYRLLGDVNGDRQVNSADQTAVTAAIGTSNPEYDVNGDGMVNSTDVLMVKRALGRKLANGLAVDD